MLIKKKIKPTGNDLNIQIPFNNESEFSGYQQEINDYTNIQTNNSINDATDGEVFKFKNINGHSKNLQFDFDGLYDGFTFDERFNEDLNYLNSFYILDFFDSISPNNQTKIFSSYLTNFSWYNFNYFEFKPSFQIYNLYFPIGKINSKKIINAGGLYNAYCRFSFYNAKTGNIKIFYNEDNEFKSTSEKIFVKTKFNLNFRDWWFISQSIINGSRLKLKELMDSQKYIERINNTVENYDNLQQNYPNDNTFDFETGQYFTPES